VGGISKDIKSIFCSICHMTNRKRLIAFIFVVLILISSISALRISPPRIEGNFQPGMETEITYTIDSTLNRNLEIYARGDLAQYVTFSENKIFQSGVVVATFKLPETIEPPGPKKTYIGVKELVDEEVGAGAMGTAIGIEALVLIHVPYPGKYLETSLSGSNANIGEPITFNLNVISRGTENVIMKPRIEIYSDTDVLLETIDFMEREIVAGETIDLKKVLETFNYGSGNYYAVSKIDYSDRTAESRFDFRIGDLVVNILNYSKQILIGGVQYFWVEIESGWNNRIDGAFADVVISNQSQEITRFRTSPTDLEAWQSNTISGYFDTTPFVPGVYNANITVNYYGRERGKSTSQLVQIEFVKKPMAKWLKISIISGAVVLGVIVLLIIFLIIRKIKNGKGKKK